MKCLNCILISVIFAFAALTEVPANIFYQGKLTSPDGVGVNDTVAATFRLFASETDGIPLWFEHHTDLPVIKGLFDVSLGEIVPFSLPFDGQYWLEITINGWTLSPRTKLATSPYAFRSLYADSVGSIRWENIVGIPDYILDSISISGPVYWSDILAMPAGFRDGIDDVDDADHSRTNELIWNAYFDEATDTLWLYEGCCNYVPIYIPRPNTFDTLYTQSLSPEDTMVVYAQFKVYGELIADSIQAVGGVIYLDDSIHVAGSATIDGDITITGNIDINAIIGQGSDFSVMSAVADLTPTLGDVPLTNITYGASGPGSTIFLTFNGVFDDQNGFNGASIVIELVRNPGGSEVILAQTEIFAYNDDFFEKKSISITGIDQPPAGTHIYEIRARSDTPPYDGGRCLNGHLILSEIKS